MDVGVGGNAAGVRTAAGGVHAATGAGRARRGGIGSVHSRRTAGSATCAFRRSSRRKSRSRPRPRSQYLRGETAGRANRDGLIVDLTRNIGGSICLVDDILPYLLPEGYPVFTVEFRVTWYQIFELRGAIEVLRFLDADPEEIAEVQFQLEAFEEAVKAGKPRSAKLPGCGTNYQRGPAVDRATGQPAVYSKPVILLVDEFPASAGEIMAAVLQDAGRVTTVGTRTAGAGGAAGGTLAGVYSEAEVALTIALGYRSKSIVSDDLPTAALIENIGIRPDIPLELMTAENLANRGKPYLDRALEIAAEKIQAVR